MLLRMLWLGLISILLVGCSGKKKTVENQEETKSASDQTTVTVRLQELHAFLGDKGTVERLDDKSWRVDCNDYHFGALDKLTPLLVDLGSVTELDLYHTSVSDLTPLSGLKQLTTLNLSFTDVSDLTPLSELTQLTTLNLYHAKRLSDLTPLSELKQLTTLNLSFTDVSDLTPLSELTQLTTLHLHYTEVSDLTPLLRLKEVTVVLEEDRHVKVPKELEGRVKRE